PAALLVRSLVALFSFLFNVRSPSDIFTLSLHDALPISALWLVVCDEHHWRGVGQFCESNVGPSFFITNAIKARQPYFCCINGFEDRKSTRLNSSHVKISYAVFCLKKKKYVTINVCSVR